MNRTKLITVRFYPKDIELLNTIKEHYKQQGKRINRSELVRNLLLNYPLD